MKPQLLTQPKLTQTTPTLTDRCNRLSDEICERTAHLIDDYHTNLDTVRQLVFKALFKNGWFE